MNNNINWLKLDNSLDDYKNRGFIEIKKTKFVNINDHNNILVERLGNINPLYLEILGWHYAGRTELNENGTQTHFYTKNSNSNEPPKQQPKQHFVTSILKKFKRKQNQ